MSTGDPRPVQPTGNPVIDRLIDALVCPTCRTIYNARKANCADLWHHDNQPASATVGEPVALAEADRIAQENLAEMERRRSALAEREAAADCPGGHECPNYTGADMNAEFARGISEGRRRAALEIAEKIANLCPTSDAEHAGDHCDFREAALTVQEYGEAIEGGGDV